MKQRRFIPWTNNLDEGEGSKVVDTTRQIKRLEYKVNSKIEKTIQCKVLESKHPVTKGYLERAKKPTTESFNCVHSEQDERLNVGLSQIQRDNIWHPYYEIKLEDEDLGTKFRKNVEAKAAQDVDGTDIKLIQQQLLQID